MLRTISVDKDRAQEKMINYNISMKKKSFWINVINTFQKTNTRHRGFALKNKTNNYLFL